MHLSTVVPVVFAALASAQPEPKPAVKGLDHYAKKAGLKYFGSATDTPGQRERAGLDAAYAQYDKIMWGGEFGQTTPTNGMKVCLLFFFFFGIFHTFQGIEGDN